jgi:Tol biopolymer transport system component
LPSRITARSSISWAIALDVREAENDVWIWDIERKTLQRLTFDPGLNTGPTWSPDGERIAFSRSIDDTEGIFWQAADGSGVPALLIDSSNALVVASEFLPDGSGLLYTERPPRDIWLVPTDDPGAGSVLLQTPASETNTSISPDGRWIAFQSDESGQIEVYVRPFPEVETGRWQISTGGGTRPRWSRDGTELFYYLGTADGTGAVMAVPIESGQNFRAGVPRMLFEGPYVAPHPGRQTFDVSLDGQRFLMIKSTAPGGSAEQPQIVVVENWLEEVRRLVSAD